MSDVTYDPASGTFSGGGPTTKVAASSAAPAKSAGVYYDPATGSFGTGTPPTPKAVAPAPIPGITKSGIDVSSHPFNPLNTNNEAVQTKTPVPLPSTASNFLPGLGQTLMRPFVAAGENQQNLMKLPDQISQLQQDKQTAKDQASRNAFNITIGPSQADIATANQKAQVLKDSSNYLDTTKPDLTNKQQVDAYNAKVAEHNKNLKDYTAFSGKLTQQQTTLDTVTNKATAYNAGDEKLRASVTGQSPTSRKFDQTLANSELLGQVYNLVNNTPGQAENDKMAVADFAQQHPGLSTMATGLGMLTDSILLSKTGAGFGLEAKTNTALGGLKYLNPTAASIVAKGTENASIFGIQSFLHEGLSQAQNQKFEAGKLASATGSGAAFGFATGGAGGFVSRTARGLASATGVAALTTVEKLVSNGKLTVKDLTDIGVNATVAGIFSFATGGSSKDVETQRMQEMQSEYQVSKIMNSGATRAEAEATAKTINTISAIKNYMDMTGKSATDPQTYENVKVGKASLMANGVGANPLGEKIIADLKATGQFTDAQLEALSKVPVNPNQSNTELNIVLKEIPESFKTLPAEEQIKIQENVSEKVSQGEPVTQAIREEMVAAGMPRGFVPPTQSPVDMLTQGKPAVGFQAPVQNPVEMMQGKTLYHGTNDINADKIKQEGFKPLTEKSGISLTDDPKIAQKMAEARAAVDGGRPIVLKVDANGTTPQTYFDKPDSLGATDREHTIIGNDISKLKVIEDQKPTGFQAPTKTPVEQMTQAAKQKTTPDSVSAYFTPAKPGSTDASRGSSGLPAGKFFALDKPFESPAHDISKVQQTNIKLGKVFDPDGVMGNPTPNGSQILREFIDNSNANKPANLRQAFSDFLVSKGFDSYVRGIDGDKTNREAIILNKTSPVKQPEPNKGSGSVTLQGGIPFVTEFVKQDVIPGVVTTSKGLVGLFRSIRNVISPSNGANPETVTVLRQMLSGRRLFEYRTAKAMRSAEKMFDKMSLDDQVAFMDRIQRGEKQPTSELQAFVDNFYTPQDKQLWDEATKEGINVDWRDNHFRIMYRQVPGANPTLKEKIFGNKSLVGSKGFMKQKTLPDLSTGIKMGGVPVTYNPARMINMAWSDMYKYITFKRFWNISVKNGDIKFLPAGKPVPEGKAMFSQNVARQLGTRSGQYVGEAPVVRMLNNIMSKDYIRSSPAGKLFFQFKNIYTGLELTLSGFHPMLITGEGIASNIGLGLQKISNSAIRLAVDGFVHVDGAQVKEDIKTMLSGVKDIATSPLASYSNTKIGNRAINSLTGKPDALTGKDILTARNEFYASKTGQWLRQAGYDEEMIDDLAGQGLLPAMAKEYQIKSLEAMKNNVNTGNFIGGILRSVPMVMHGIMMPTFEIYIPRITWGTALRQYAYDLKANEGRLEKGQITRGELARKVVDSMYNRMGEMNWDTIMWNNTFKSAMQGFFRSVLFKGGTARELGIAPYEQGREFYNAYKEGRAPMLTGKMAHLMALLLLGAIMGEIITKLSTGKNINQLKDIFYPEIDKEGDRVALPTYLIAIYSFGRSPSSSISNSFSGFIGKIIENWQNKDFYSNEIYSQNDPAWVKYAKELWNLKPSNFAISSYQNQPTNAGKLASFAGLTKAPRYVTNTDIQNKIYDLYNQRFGGGTKSPLQTQKADTSKQYKTAVAAGDTKKAEDIKAQAISDGVYTERGFGMVQTHLKTGTDKVLFDRLPQDDKDSLIKQMTAAEKDYYTTKSSSSSSTRSGRSSGRSGSSRSGRK